MHILSKSLGETKKAAHEVLILLKSHKNERDNEPGNERNNEHADDHDRGEEGSKATIVGLQGDLGSGKTTFSQSIAEELGVLEGVTSPTFVIEKIYDTKDDVFKKFIHIDAYRLESGAELNVLDFQRLISDPKNLIFIEWPEIVADILPKDAITISFSFIDESTRSITYEI